MNGSKTLEMILLEISTLRDFHSPSHPLHQFLKKIAKEKVQSLFSKETEKIVKFAPFGEVILPYFKMGAIDSLDLFGLDELIIFSFYWKTKNRYKKVLDIGGNIGLHSILLDRCGFEVDVYEPDPVHYQELINNLKRNHCQRVIPHCEAVSNREGTAHFTRVLGNTTSSHLTGSKQPYGELETFSVLVRDIKNLIQSVDLMKMDVEGHEKDILLHLNAKDFGNMDAIVEIGSPENAKQVFEHFNAMGVNLFSQKTGWKKVTIFEEMPTSHRDGSLFISQKNEMPWETQ